MSKEKIDVVEIQHELQKAVATLILQYAVAKQQERIRNPVAYALYCTWQEADHGKI